LAATRGRRKGSQAPERCQGCMPERCTGCMPERCQGVRCAGAGADGAGAGVSAESVPLEAEDEGPQAEALSGYVVSIVGRKRFRRLHHIAKCGLLPGTDYKEFTWYGEVLPDPTLYDQICARCWRRRAVFDLETAKDPAADNSASSSGESDAS